MSSIEPGSTMAQNRPISGSSSSNAATHIYLSDKTMKKTIHHPAAKAGPSVDEKNEVLADRLVELALFLRESDAYAVLSDTLQKAQAYLRKSIKKCLQQQREQALDE